MSPLVVGLLNHSGNVGAAFLQVLLKAHEEGRVKLVILHRKESNLSSIPSGIETRVLDVENGSQRDIETAVEGIEVIISTLPGTKVSFESNLIKPLAASKSFKLFIPSGFGTPWTDEELAQPGLSWLKEKNLVYEKFDQAKVAYAVIYNGLFTEFAFKYKFGGIDVQANSIQIYKDALNKPFPLSPITDVAIATTNYILSVSDPSKLAGKHLNTIQYSPTGSDLVKILTDLHGGSQTKIISVSEEDLQKALAKPGPAALEAGLKAKWSSGNWGYQGRLEPGPGVEVKDLKELISSYL